ncbi:RNase H domain-containing protein [Trichonephila clavipes]|nr:RNase H domain-containing protein [Trichonephila clavipes]
MLRQTAAVFSQSRMLQEAGVEFEFRAKIAAFESQKTTALNSQIKKVIQPTYLGVTLDPELRFSKHIEQTANNALGKLNILRKLSGTSWGSRPQTLKSTFCTVIRPVLEYATPIWTPASISVKRKLDSVQHSAAKIIIGAVSSTSNEKAEQESGLPPLESMRKLATIKLTNKLRSYGLDHMSRRVFDKWKHSTRLKRSSTVQLDSEIRKELNLEHSSLEFLQEPLIPKNPPKNTCFELELLQPCSIKEDPVTLRQKGLETIAILSQDNFAIAYTHGSSDRSLSNGGAGIILLLPDGNNYKHKINTGIITSNFTRELMAIREALILYQQDPHVIDSTEGHEDSPRQDKVISSMQTCPDLQLTPNHILECPTVATKLLKMGMVPLRDSLRELLYIPDAPRIAEAVIKIFDGI